jgi:hypothetical protein
LDEAQPFAERIISLGAIPATGLTVNLEGGQLLFRREGSSPNARIDIALGSGAFQSFYPGARIVGRFASFRVVPSANSLQLGIARLVIIKPGYDFFEPANISANSVPPTDLVGGTTPVAWISAPLATNPTASDAYAVQGVGFSKLRMFVQASGTFSDITVTPWLFDIGGPDTGPGGTGGAEQLQGQFIIPGSSNLVSVSIINIEPMYGKINDNVTISVDAQLGFRFDCASSVTLQTIIQGIA